MIDVFSKEFYDSLIRISLCTLKTKEDAEDAVQKTYLQYLLSSKKNQILDPEHYLKKSCRLNSLTLSYLNRTGLKKFKKDAQNIRKEFINTNSNKDYQTDSLEDLGRFGVSFNEGDINYDIKLYKEEIKRKKEELEQTCFKEVMQVSFYKLNVKYKTKEKENKTYGYYTFREKGCS